MRRAVAVMVCTATLVVGALSVMQTEAERPGVAPAFDRRQSPLATLPSANGAHVARIDALGNNAWLNLGPPANDPRWGRALGRSWSPKMPFAPGLRGAFLFGEGNHGWFNRETRRYMDDLWFYDIPAHRWVSLYPGAHVDKLELKITDEGFEATPEGEPIPVASMVHAYEMVTYDTDLKRFMHMPCPGVYWQRALGVRRELAWGPDLRKEMRLRGAKHASPWFFDTVTAKWGRLATEPPTPHSAYGDILAYVPTRKQVFFHNFAHGRNVTWFYEPGANRWTLVSKGSGPPYVRAASPTACYDEKRDRIYVVQGTYSWAFDVPSLKWVDLQPRTNHPSVGSHGATLTCDTVNDAVVLNVYRRDQPGIHVYDPVVNTWTYVSKGNPMGETGNKNAFYDPGLNAHFFYSAVDNREGEMWVYRYRRPSR